MSLEQWTNIGGYVLMALVGLLMLVVAVRYVRSRVGPIRTVRARVVDKQKLEFYSKTGRNVRCVIVFEIGDKKKSFYVSEFSYGGYRRNESGTLKYRGDRIIDFY